MYRSFRFNYFNILFQWLESLRSLLWSIVLNLFRLFHLGSLINGRMESFLFSYCINSAHRFKSWIIFMLSYSQYHFCFFSMWIFVSNYIFCYNLIFSFYPRVLNKELVTLVLVFEVLKRYACVCEFWHFTIQISL